MGSPKTIITSAIVALLAVAVANRVPQLRSLVFGS